MKFNKAVIVLGLCLLTVFEANALDWMPKWSALGDAEEKPAWHNEKLVNSDNCDSFTYENVQNFIKSYNLEEAKQKASAKDVAASKELMESYTMASVLINRSQLCLAQALDLKEVSENLLKEKEILLSGTSLSKNEVAKHREYSKAASLKIVNATKEADQLTEEQRKTFALGAATYLAGGYTTQRTAEDAVAYLEVVSNMMPQNSTISKTSTPGVGNILDNIQTVSNIFSKGSKTANAAKTLTNLSAGVDDHLLNIVTTSKSIYQYSRKQKLDLPPDASKYVTF